MGHGRGQGRGRRLIVGLAGMLLAGPVTADVLHVDPAAPGLQDGSSWDDAFHDLDSALAQAGAGDELRLAGGVYVPSVGAESFLRSFDLPAGVALRGSFAGFGAAQPDEQDLLGLPTILDGDQLGDDVPFDLSIHRFDNSHHVVTVAPGPGSTQLEGLVIRGGHARAAGIDQRGGAVLLLSGELALRDCRLEDSAVMQAGGALYAGPGSVVDLRRSAFVGCQVGGTGDSARGGAVALDQAAATLVACRFEDNLGLAPAFPNGVSGGALWIDDAAAGDGLVPRIERCHFEGNGSEHDGGALSLSGEGQVIGCAFVGNAVGPGLPPFGLASGGAASLSGRIDVVSCRFVGNRSSSPGSGLGSALLLAGGDPLVAQTQFSGNGGLDGAAALQLLATQGARIVGCSLANNLRDPSGSAPGLGTAGLDIASLSSGTLVSDSILWGHLNGLLSDELAQLGSDDPTAVFERNLVQGWTGGLGGTDNSGADPLLVDPPGVDNLIGTLDDDLRLQPGSPAIDAGDSAAVPLDAVDLDCDGDLAEALPLDLAGHVRRVDDPATIDLGSGAPVVDRGALEFGAALPTDIWIDLGGGTPGAAGSPTLVGSGSFCEGQAVALELVATPPGSLVLLLESLASTPVPKWGGVVHPIPIFAQFLLVTDATGGLQLQVTLPIELPAGLTVHYQVLVNDPSLSPPIGLSNGVRAITP